MVRAPITVLTASLVASAGIVACAGVVACATSPASAPSAPASASASPADGARHLTVATPLTTASGAPLTAPEGWWLTDQNAGAIVLEDPDRALRLAIIEAPTEDDALARAWSLARPAASAPVADPPDDDAPGTAWEASRTLHYAASGSPAREAYAFVRRLGATTYVVLADGDPDALARREAQLYGVVESLRPAALVAESFAGRAPQPIGPEQARALDDFLAAALAQTRVPGAAVAVISKGRVVYERTLGVRSLDGRAPITPATLFLLASVTKPLTTLMEARLVDALLVRWETPLTTLLPDFALADAALTAQVQLWHTSCACTGMPRQDLENLFEYATVTPEQRLASMRAMRPTTALGETFQYSNLMVAAGGFAAAHARSPTSSLASAYARAMAELLFAPIGMVASTVDFALVERADHAVPHALDLDGHPVPMPLAIEKNVLPIAPAGAVWSSLRDMERYAAVELSRGVTPEGQRVVSAEGVEARWQQRVASGADSGYGLGIDVGTVNGLRVIGHDGGAMGFGTSLYLLPDLDVALVILTNARSGGGYAQLPFNDATKRFLLEQLFPGARAVARPLLAWQAAQRAKLDVAMRADVDRAPDVRALAGVYGHPALGRVEIRGNVLDAGEWQVRFGRRDDALVVLDPPFAGTSLLLEHDEAQRPLLVVPYPQAPYQLRRVDDAAITPPTR